MRQSRSVIWIAVFLVWCISFSIPCFANAQENAKTPLSIQNALDIAYKNNPDILKTSLAVDKAQLNADNAAQAVTWIPNGGLVSSSYQQVMNNSQQANINLILAKKANASEKDSITKEVINAYTSALKSFNSIQIARDNLQDMKQQMMINSLAKSIGITSDSDFAKMQISTKQLEETYNAAQLSYNSSIATLRTLVGESDEWQPELTSTAAITKYVRSDLTIEISRGISQSTSVYTKGAALDIEKSKQQWVLPNISSDMQNINLSSAEIDYEQAKRSAHSSIEQLYYSIDSLEGQIQSYNNAYTQAQQDLQTAQLKYDLGLIAKYSSASSSASLASFQLAAEKARINLENSRGDLANLKAQFGYLTGQTVYEAGDWVSDNPANK